MDDDEVDRIGKEVVSYASKRKLTSSVEFVNALGKYYKQTVLNVPKIEGDLGSKVDSQELASAFRTIGRTAVKVSLQRKSKKVESMDLGKALAISKGLHIDLGESKSLSLACPHPTCWSATASIIRNRRKSSNSGTLSVSVG